MEAINPRGLFDRSVKGAIVPPIAVQVERGRIRFFAQTLGEEDPIHLDSEAARAAGHHDIVAPPSFFMVIEAIANEELERCEQPSLLRLLKSDYRYLLHGEERYFYSAPIYAGEEVLLSTRVVDFFDRKGGAIEGVVLESLIEHETRGVLLRSRRTLLHRLPGPKEERRGVH